MDSIEQPESDKDHESLARPTKEELLAANGVTVADIIAPGLDVVFCGINPSVYSGVVGHHFARPGNRFWKALHGGGFTDEVWSPANDHRLIEVGVGITNLVDRATVAASELDRSELEKGARRLERKIRRNKPRILAVLGIGAFSAAFGGKPSLGRQPGMIGGTTVFVLPNPSGLQARYQLPELSEMFREVRETAAALRAGARLS